MKRLALLLTLILAACAQNINQAIDYKIGTLAAATLQARPPDKIQSPIQPTRHPTVESIYHPLFIPTTITGLGDSVRDFSIPSGPGVLHITGNQYGRANFAVISYQNNEYLDLLVNTVDPYDGYRPVNMKNQKTDRFKITASSKWSITWLPIDPQYIHALTIPGNFNGKNDDVLILQGATPDIANVVDNNSSRNLAIISYSKAGEYLDLLVNTTDPYQGSVLLSPETYLLDIVAKGPWTIEVTARK